MGADGRAGATTRAGTGGLFLTAAGVVVPVAMGVALWVALSHDLGQFGMDLGVYHRGVLRALEQHDAYAALYDGLPFAYPPTALLLLAPLALPIGLVEPLFFALSAVAWLLCVRTVVDRERALSRWSFVLDARSGLVGGLLLCSTPVLMNLHYGQINLVLTIAVLLDVLVLRDRRGSGVLVGLATCIKLTPGLVVVWLFLVGRRAMAWRAVLTVLAVGAVTVLAVSASARGYFEDGARGSFDSNLPAHDLANQSVLAWFERVTDSTSSLTVTTALGLSAVLAVLGLWLTVRCWNAGLEAVAITAVGVLTAVVEPLGWLHHLVWLPLFALAVWAARDRLPGATVVAALALAVSFMPGSLFVWVGAHGVGTLSAGLMTSVPLTFSVAAGVWLAAAAGRGDRQVGEDRAGGLLDRA